MLIATGTAAASDGTKFIFAKLTDYPPCNNPVFKSF